jgi:hypothetical protein
MKQNLNEQMSRIKSMMGLNEEKIKLSDYNSEDDVIKDIYLVRKDKRYATIAFHINTIIFDRNDKTQSGVGEKVTFIAEVAFEATGRIAFVYDVDVDPSTSEDVKNDWIAISYYQDFIEKSVFSVGRDFNDALERIYNPFLSWATTNNKPQDYIEKIIENRRKNKEKILSLLRDAKDEALSNLSKEPKVKDEPKMDVTPKEEPKKDTSKGDMWTSTSSWASE